MPSFEEICARYEVNPQDVVYCFTLSDGTYRLIMKDGFNPVYSVLWDDDSDIQISFGGRGSGKSNDMSRRIVATNYAGHNWLVTRYFKVDLKMSCFNEILSVIDDWGLTAEYTVDKTTLTITCKHNGRQIIFGALEEPRRLKSIKPKVGVLTDIFMEEADECPNLASFGMLQACLRGIDKEAAKRGLPQPHKRVVLAFNPILPTHWMHEYFFKPLWKHPDVKSVEELKKLKLKDKVAKGVVDGLKVTMLKTTYVDNKFLTEEDIRQRESATGQRMWVDTLQDITEGIKILDSAPKNTWTDWDIAVNAMPESGLKKELRAQLDLAKTKGFGKDDIQTLNEIVGAAQIQTELTPGVAKLWNESEIQSAGERAKQGLAPKSSAMNEYEKELARVQKLGLKDKIQKASVIASDALNRKKVGQSVYQVVPHVAGKRPSGLSEESKKPSFNEAKNWYLKNYERDFEMRFDQIGRAHV